MKIKSILNVVLAILIWVTGCIGMLLVLGSARPFELDEISALQFLFQEALGLASIGVSYVLWVLRENVKDFYFEKR